MISTKSPDRIADNVLARNALQEISRIELEAQEKKLGQLESLQSGKTNIRKRIEELQSQLAQLDDVIARITGKAPQQERRQRRDLSDERERVARWMAGHRGRRFAAGDLTREFPELDGTPISIFLKPLVQEGRIKTDSSDGMRRTKYFVS